MGNIFLEWDQQLFVLINQSLAFKFLDPLMIVLSSSKTFIPFYIWGIVVLIKKFRVKAWIPLVWVLLAFTLADGISAKILKPAFQRVRPAFEEHLHARLPQGPPGGRHGFVSSHSANAFAVYPLLLLVVFYQKGKQISQNKIQKCATILVFFTAFWIAYSRVYLGLHYVGVVLFGGLLGWLIWKLLSYLYIHHLYEKYMETPELT
jgi:undecaprenyl-diphosphatase